MSKAKTDTALTAAASVDAATAAAKDVVVDVEVKDTEDKSSADAAADSKKRISFEETKAAEKDSVPKKAPAAAATATKGAEGNVEAAADANAKIAKSRRIRIGLLWCIGIFVVLAAILVPVGLLVIAPKIAQKAIDDSIITFSSINISGMQNDKFSLGANGVVSNAGNNDGTLSFNSNPNVYWTANGGDDILLGSVALPPVSISGGSPKTGAISMSGAQFTVTDQTAMGKFSKFMINSPSFSWRLQSDDVKVKSMGLTLSCTFNKVVTVSSFNGFKDGATINSLKNQDFNLAEGPHIVSTATLINPSNITIDLGDITFDIYYSVLKFATVSSSNITVFPGPNNQTLAGQVIPLVDSALLQKVMGLLQAPKGTLLSVIGAAVTPSSGSVGWLTSSFVGLNITASLNI